MARILNRLRKSPPKETLSHGPNDHDKGCGRLGCMELRALSWVPERFSRRILTGLEGIDAGGLRGRRSAGICVSYLPLSFSLWLLCGEGWIVEW